MEMISTDLNVCFNRFYCFNLTWVESTLCMRLNLAFLPGLGQIKLFCVCLTQRPLMRKKQRKFISLHFIIYLGQ